MPLRVQVLYMVFGSCNLSSNAKIGVQYLNANNYLDAIFVHANLGEGQGHTPESAYQK